MRKIYVIIIILLLSLLGCDKKSANTTLSNTNKEETTATSKIDFKNDYNFVQDEYELLTTFDCSYDEAYEYFKDTFKNLSSFNKCYILKEELYLSGTSNNNVIILYYKNGTLSLNIRKSFSNYELLSEFPDIYFGEEFEYNVLENGIKIKLRCSYDDALSYRNEFTQFIKVGPDTTKGNWRYEYTAPTENVQNVIITTKIRSNNDNRQLIYIYEDGVLSMTIYN